MQFSVRLDNTRMAALRAAFSAALRRSQDFSIGDQKHQHADRSASEAHGFFCASNSLHGFFCASNSQSCLVRKITFPRAVAPLSLLLPENM